jgi:hypothetical protein
MHVQAHLSKKMEILGTSSFIENKSSIYWIYIDNEKLFTK